MKYISRDENYLLAYNTTFSAQAGAGKFVTNHVEAFPGTQLSIIIPSGTAGFEVWANNSSEYTSFVQEATITFSQPDTYGSLSAGNILTGSFSSNWINITTYPNVTIGADAFFIEGAIRFIRLQGTSVSGSSSAANGWFFTDCMFPR